MGRGESHPGRGQQNELAGGTVQTTGRGESSWSGKMVARRLGLKLMGINGGGGDGVCEFGVER